MDELLPVSDLSFALGWSRPGVLYGLLAVPLLLLVRRFGRWSSLTTTSLVLRAVFVALLILAAAGPQRLHHAPASPPVLVLDVSDSLTAAQREWVQTTVSQAVRPDPDWPVIAFAGGSRRLAWREAAVLGEPLEELRPGETDIGAALGRLLEDDRTRRAYVFSDGWETRGAATDVVPALARHGLRVYPFPPPGASPPNVALRRLGVPLSGVGGRDVEIAVAVENTNPSVVRGRLSVTQRERVVWQQDTELRPGTSLLTHPLRLSESGLIPIQATFTPTDEAFDVVPADNRATAWIRVAPTERILLLSGSERDNRYLQAALTSRGLDVTTLAANTGFGGRRFEAPALQTFASVILNNIASHQLPAAFRRGVDSYVNNGGGLVMVGGEHSLGLGRYAGSAVENVLPVRMRPPQREVRRSAILLVIDKSGSMRTQRKLQYAKLGARAVARNLKDTDLFGVIGFDKTPFVVAPLDYLGKTRQRLDEQIERLKPSGGTLLLPALREARRQLERQHATRKHIVVLTDGETGGSGSDYLDLASLLHDSLDITVSAIAVGTQPNLRLLSRLADYGGGAFHHTLDPSTLPDLFLDELNEPPTEKTLVERALRPLPHPASPLLAELADARLPAVMGYVQTTLKKGARADLSLRDGGKRPPLLASWSYGRGRAVAFTSDANGRWSAPWIDWGRYGQFWEQTVRWSFANGSGGARDAPTGAASASCSVEVGHDDTGLIVEVFFYDSDAGLPLNGAVTATVSGLLQPDTALVLEPVASGRYQGVLSGPAPGDYTLSVVLPTGEQLGPFGYTLPSRPREAPRQQANLKLLDKLAVATGGALSPDPAALHPPAGPLRRRPLLPYLVGLAMVVYVLEVFFRRRTS